MYLTAPEAPNRILRVAPNTRILVSICDPVERAWRAINHMVRRTRDPSKFDKALSQVSLFRVTFKSSNVIEAMQIF